MHIVNICRWFVCGGNKLHLFIIMIFLFKKTSRNTILEKITNEYSQYEIVRFHETINDISEVIFSLQGQSLFGKPQLVFLSDIPRDFWDILIKNLHSLGDQTVVFWLEDSFPVSFLKQMPPYQISEEKEIEKTSKTNPFVIASSLPNGNGEQLWSIYQQLLQENNEPEAIFGILWWKLKDIAKQKKVLSPDFKQTLKNFMETYSRAREKNGELSVGLEKLLLSITKKDLV